MPLTPKRRGHPTDCGGPGACSACDYAADSRRELVEEPGECAPASDPRSRYGDVRDWNYPRGYGGLQ